jgi:putative transposase
MKYAWIEKHKLRWPVCVQCRVLEVSASGYRQHLARRKKILVRRHLSETALLVEIRAVYVAARVQDPQVHA